MRVGAASLLAAIALVAAGCGSGGGGGGPNALPAGAKVVPASAPVMISIRTDFSSPQWTNAFALLHEFPGAGDLLRRARVESGNVDFEQDVRPALGPEVDVVWLDFANGGNDVVGLTQPKSKAKFAALIAKLNTGTPPKTVSAEVGGWTVVADSRSKIDAFRHASTGDKLADDGPFKDALSRLDEHAGVRAYVAGAPVQRALDRALEQGGGAQGLTHGLTRLDSLSAAAVVERHGVRLDSALASDPAANPKTYTPTLPGSLPAGALLYLSTGSLADPTRAILKLIERSKPKFETQLNQFLTVLGLSLQGDIYPLISREQALAVYPATPIPKIVFLAKVPDPGRARDLVARVLQLAKLSGTLTVTSFEAAGESVSDVSTPGSSVHVLVAVAGGKLIVTTTGLETLATLIEGKGPTLAHDQLYLRARADAKVPAKVAGLVYADLTHGLPFAFDLAEANGSFVPPEARANTEPLSHVLLYAEQDGNRFRLSGFVAIK
jgi:hypothetical protein